MSKKILIGIKENNIVYKITSIYLLSDGSFKVDIPYCKYDKGIISRFTLEYGTGTHITTENEFFSASNRPQLSIHASGLVQFSGKGVKSGVDGNGRIKGVGIKSLPLSNPISSGPTFGIQVWGLKNGFEKCLESEKCDITYDVSNFVIRKRNKKDKMNTYILEGSVFPPNKKLEKYCISKKDNNEKITLEYPNYFWCYGAIFSFDVIRLRKIESFIGIGPFVVNTEFADKHSCGFVLGGPTEHVDKKRRGMLAMFPNVYGEMKETLDYVIKII